MFSGIPFVNMAHWLSLDFPVPKPLLSNGSDKFLPEIRIIGSENNAGQGIHIGYLPVILSRCCNANWLIMVVCVSDK